MKLKQDFVTNSSSTSYIIVCKEEMDAEEFINILWENGLGEAIKKQFISDMRSDCPFQKGVNQFNASSEDFENFFSQLLYYNDVVPWNKVIGNDKVVITQGCPEDFIDERENNDEESINKFSEGFRCLIEEYIKKNTN